jgi:hypothetical protein
MREQDVPSITVVLLSGSAGAMPGQMPPFAGTKTMVTVTTASPGQIPPTAAEPVLASTLGAALAPRVLNEKKLAVKKSALSVFEYFYLYIVGSSL